MREPDSDGARIPSILIVVPCFNEEACLPVTLVTLNDKIQSLIKKNSIAASSSIVFVDDGSMDETWQIIVNGKQTCRSIVHGLRLSHNRGHQIALLAGLTYAVSNHFDAVISLDADLQDDVNVIDKMIGRFTSGDDIVYGVRRIRDKDTWFKRTTANLFYRLFRWLGAEVIENHADFRLMSYRAVEALCRYQEVNLFLRGIVPTLGYRTSIIYYKRGERVAGESKYPVKKMISFAIEGITSFSIRPLHFITVLGSFFIVGGLAMLIYVLVSFSQGSVVSGWGSIICSIWIVGGFIMISLGLIGEYMGKIYLETKHRPRFFIQDEF